MKNLILVVTIVLFAGGCAQVPKESVELSTTVGRDLAVTQQAHVELATLLFQRMKDDVNRFIDNTYAPYQIRAAMERQKQLADSNDPKLRRISLLLAINAAFKPGASEDLQAKTLKGMEILISHIRKDVEKMRAELLVPLNEQEQEVIGSINRAYQQMHYANSIVTGHLASVVKVHDAQNDLLMEFGVERDLRKEIGEGIAAASEEISAIVESAEKAGSKLEGAEEKAKSLRNTIAGLGDAIDKDKEKADE